MNLRLPANAKKGEIRARLLVPAVPARPSQSGEPTPQANAPVKIYVWELRAGTQKPVTSADLFAYLDGAFRFFGELPPPPTGTPERIRVGSNVMVAKLLHMVSPTPPPEVRSARIQGTVRLRVVIGKDGTVQDLNVLEGHPILAKSAVEAVRQWRYQPTLLNGEPVEVETTIDVVFTLSR